MKNRKYYLKNLLEEELKKKQESDVDKSEKKKCEDGDGLDDCEQDPVNTEPEKKVEPSDEKPDEDKVPESTSDDKKKDECDAPVKSVKNEGKKAKKEDEEPCDDADPGADDDVDVELESKKKNLKNEAVIQIKTMIESGATPEQIAEELISVARESVMEMVDAKTKILESEIEANFAEITERIISENESQMIRVSSEVVTEKLKSLKEKQETIVSENESYKATIEKMLAEAKEQDALMKTIKESLDGAIARGNVFENAMFFNESTAGMSVSEVDRISEIVTEEQLKLSHDEYKKVFESALSDLKVQANTEQRVVNESEDVIVNEEDQKFKQVMELACAVASVSKWH
jgi:hypothetical protein